MKKENHNLQENNFAIVKDLSTFAVLKMAS